MSLPDRKNGKGVRLSVAKLRGTHILKCSSFFVFLLQLFAKKKKLKS